MALNHTANDRSLAQRSLDESARCLAPIEYAALAPDQARTYSDAVGMLHTARIAMQKHDYAAARALGDKATRIAATLKPKRKAYKPLP